MGVFAFASTSNMEWLIVAGIVVTFFGLRIYRKLKKKAKDPDRIIDEVDDYVIPHRDGKRLIVVVSSRSLTEVEKEQIANLDPITEEGLPAGMLLANIIFK